MDSMRKLAPDCFYEESILKQESYFYVAAQATIDFYCMDGPLISGVFLLNEKQKP